MVQLVTAGLVVLCAGMVSCEAWQGRPYDLVAGGGTVGNLVYRIDRKSGEVCAFRWWPSREPRYQGDQAQQEGFALIGCER